MSVHENDIQELSKIYKIETQGIKVLKEKKKKKEQKKETVV